MQYLNTFWKTVVYKIPYLGLKLRERELRERRLRKRLVAALTAAGLAALTVEGLAALTVEMERLPLNPKTRNSSSVEIKQKSYTTGWPSKFLPEEWRGELEALRDEWLKEDKSEHWIKIMTGFYLMDLLKAYLQIKVENIWLPKNKRS